MVKQKQLLQLWAVAFCFGKNRSLCYNRCSHDADHDLLNSGENLYLSYPVSWVLTFAIHIACYVILRKRLGAMHSGTVMRNIA